MLSIPLEFSFLLSRGFFFSFFLFFFKTYHWCFWTVPGDETAQYHNNSQLIPEQGRFVLNNLRFWTVTTVSTICATPRLLMLFQLPNEFQFRDAARTSCGLL